MHTNNHDSDLRQSALALWCARHFNCPSMALSVVSGDASFRRYFRFIHTDTPYIAVDAPPEKEDCAPFIAIAQDWRAQGIHTPQVINYDLTQGFMLLEDFGDALLLPSVQTGTKAQQEALYQQALTVLVDIAALSTSNKSNNNASSQVHYPAYDAELLRQEMQLFDDWFYQRHGNNTAPIPQCFAELMQVLIDNALEQPQVIVHRDYHARNIMLCPSEELGIIDFQDAVIGALTYDAVSLLKDCYIAWDRQTTIQRLRFFFERVQHQLPASTTFNTFTQWFDLMGLQRHIKVAGIFCRLYYRDGKSTYLDDLPLVLHYISETSHAYAHLPAVRDFSVWFRLQFQQIIEESPSLNPSHEP